jgi:long-chain fatty acid transport protein
MRRSTPLLLCLVAVLVTATSSRVAYAQSFGIELHNTLMPASGGMAGTSIARPQDVISSMGGNPATLTQFEGTNFTFGGGWIESTYDLAHVGGVLPNLGTFSAKSEQEGSALGNIGVSHDLDVMGLPATMGLALMSTAGAGLSFRNVPESNGTSVSLSVLQIGSGIGVDLTDRLSVGATLALGSSTFDAPFQGVSAATLAYSLRGSVGAGYQLGCSTYLGLTYHTEQNFNYDDAIRLQLPNGFAPVADVNAGLPANWGLGIANDALMNGRLLLAADVLFKQWEKADLFDVLYTNQWVFQLGAQFELNERVRLRAGYVYAENPLDMTLGDSAGGIIPPVNAQAALQYVQSTVAVINHHRMAIGAGVRDIMPGVDFDMYAGGMFGAGEDLGDFTAVHLSSYWVGGGLTWRYGRRCQYAVSD